MLNEFCLKSPGENLDDLDYPEGELLMCFNFKEQDNFIKTHDFKYILADTTFSTNREKLLLSVFFTLAEDERCIPFVYIITSSEAAPVISYCLNKFKQFYSGHFFEIKVFMSDMARNFNNAIIEVFGQSHIWLWCAYHF